MRTLLITLAASAALTVPAAAQSVPDGGGWADCAVSSVVAFRDRLVVRCAPLAVAGGEMPREFALEMTDPLADITLRMALEAKGRGKPLNILYVKNAASNPAGCAAERCRRLAGLELK